MTKPQRSPLGKLVYAYRKHLHLTQAGLADLASHPANPALDQATVSVRTVSDIEQKLPPDAPKPRPRRPATIRALAEAFDLTPDTPAYDEFLAAARESSADDAAPPFPDPEVPLFVPDGREAHLERLAAAIDMAAGERAGVLFVEAAPGTGKTTLVAHVCRQALDRHDRLVVLWGDCVGRTGAADPWQPFRQALGTLVGDTAAAGHQQLLSGKNAGRIAFRAPMGIRTVVDDAPGLIDRFISPEAFRAQARAGRLDAETSRRLDRALDAASIVPAAPLDPGHLVFRVIRRYAASGPVILVLEDLHWADTGTADMLAYLMRGLERQRLPVLVIATYRPLDLESSRLGDHPAVRHVLTEAIRRFDDPILDLADTVGGAPGRAFVNAVVDQILPDAPHAFREILFEQTAGLPLFVLTMLRWYLDEGQPFPSEADAAGDPVPARLPAVIETLFAGLIDRLPPEFPPLLDAASVQGATFSAEVVMRVMGLSRSILIERLDDQLTLRFKALSAGGVTTIAGQRGHDYHFSHALLRDYLYHRLSRLRREHLHAATAEAMLALYGDGEHDGAAGIAWHFDQAGERQRAAAYFIKAGLAAMARHEYTGARRHFQRVGELKLRKQDPFVVAQALIGLGNCAYGEGHPADAARLFERAHDLALRERLPLPRAACLTSMGRLDFDAGRMREGVVRVTNAVELLTELGDEREACRALGLLSHLHYGLGHYDDAVRAAQRAITLGTRLQDDLLIVNGLTALANCWLDLGLYDEAEIDLRRAIGLSEEHGSTHRASLCWLNLALGEFERERWESASAAIEIVFDPARNATSRLLGLAEFNAGLVAEAREEWVVARQRFQASFDIRVANGQHALTLDSLAGLLRVATAQRRHAELRPLTAEIGRRVESEGLDGVGHPGWLFASLAG
ncbi:MAG: AAA family ATPase, partial [Chloroflexia bacterium]|nr:AAA family ATPase [Chloroflexia bacterium]